MNKDTVIRLAREAGFDVEAVEGTDEVLERESDYYTRHPDIGYMVQTHTVERFAALVAAAEREECAKVCESLKPTMRAYDHRFWDACHESAAAIRSKNA